MDLQDQLAKLVSKEIRLSFYFTQSLQLSFMLPTCFLLLFHMTSFQGSRGALGQEGVTGLDGEEVDRLDCLSQIRLIFFDLLVWGL